MMPHYVYFQCVSFGDLAIINHAGPVGRNLGGAFFFPGY